MNEGENFLLCSAVLHGRLYMATQVLEVLIANSPRPVTIAELRNCTGYLARELRTICASLQESSLLKRDSSEADGWQLACNPSEVTLEDVYRSVTANISTPRGSSGTKTVDDAELNTFVDILLMQATLATSQSIRKQLRQFSLDRLKSHPAPVLRHTTSGKKQDLK